MSGEAEYDALKDALQIFEETYNPDDQIHGQDKLHDMKNKESFRQRIRDAEKQINHLQHMIIMMCIEMGGEIEVSTETLNEYDGKGTFISEKNENGVVVKITS